MSDQASLSSADHPLRRKRRHLAIVSVAILLVAIGLSTTCRAENLDVSEASVTEVHRRLESGWLVIGVIAENHSAVKANIGIECAAWQDENAIQSESFAVHAVGPGKKGYDEVEFDQVHRIGVVVTCWIDDLETAE